MLSPSLLAFLLLATPLSQEESEVAPWLLAMAGASDADAPAVAAQAQRFFSSRYLLLPAAERQPALDRLAVRLREARSSSPTVAFDANVFHANGTINARHVERANVHVIWRNIGPSLPTSRAGGSHTVRFEGRAVSTIRMDSGQFPVVVADLVTLEADEGVYTPPPSVAFVAPPTATATAADLWRLLLAGFSSNRELPPGAAAVLAPVVGKNEFERARSQDASDAIIARARASKDKSARLSFALGAVQSSYDFKRKGYVISALLENAVIDTGHDLINPLPLPQWTSQGSGKFFLPMDPAFAEQEISWRFAHEQMPLVISAHLTNVRVETGAEQRRRSPADFLMGDPPAKLFVKVDKLSITTYDGIALGIATELPR